MKTSLMILLMTFLGFTMYAGEGDAAVYSSQHGKLLVEVDGLASADGNLKVLLFHSELGYPLEEWNALYALDVKLDDTKALINFESIPFREYALFVYHDENNNGKLDKNWAGVSKESYGFSNEVSGVRVMPLYSDSVFDFNTDGQLVKIQMIRVGKKASKLEVSKK